MKTFALVTTLAAATVIASFSAASAQTIYFGDPPPRYQRNYDAPRYYDDRRGYRDDRRYQRRARAQCPRGYTVQSGVCKPYRGY